MNDQNKGNLDTNKFIDELLSNELKTPNEFTIRMGKLIKDAREENLWSQSELAERIHRRPATISDIENGKSDISIQTLLVLAIVLGKPISYFFPKSLLKDMVMDVKTPFQHKALNYLGIIEFFGEQKMTLDILEAISDSCKERIENKDDFDDFPPSGNSTEFIINE